MQRSKKSLRQTIKRTGRVLKAEVDGRPVGEKHRLLNLEESLSTDV